MVAVAPAMRGAKMSAIVQPLTGHRFPADQVLDAVVAQNVVIQDRAEVRAYLEQHSDLASLVPHVVAHTRQVFGDDAELTLYVYHDIEDKDDHYLKLGVRLANYEPGLQEFFDTIWAPFEDVYAEVASGYFLVTTDHRRPE
jgi:hypothetical protein